LLKRCLPAAMVAATLLLPATARAEPVTIAVHSLAGGATASLASTATHMSSIGVVTLPSADGSINIMFDGLTARLNYEFELLIHGSTATWNTLQAEVLDPLDEDDGLDVLPFSAGVPDGFTGSNTRDGFSFAQSAGLERSAIFAGGSASVFADENTNATDALRFVGLADAAGGVRVTFGLRDFDGGRTFLVRLTAGDPIATPEPMSMLLVGTGLAGLAAVRRRRRQPQEPPAAE
jgi:hypothetical protein